MSHVDVDRPGRKVFIVKRMEVRDRGGTHFAVPGERGRPLTCRVYKTG